jgi:predicted nuclease with TOPRIM domain
MISRFEELKRILRSKRKEYQDLRQAYELIKKQFEDNVNSKKALREEIEILYKEYSEIKNEQTGTTIPPKKD